MEMSRDEENCIYHIASYGERTNVFGWNTGVELRLQEALFEPDIQEEWTR